MDTLLTECDQVTAFRDGTTASLLESMQTAGISRSVICSIATRPEQWRPILDWSLSIRSKKLIPLASVHPYDPDANAHLKAVSAAGLPGIKLHPYYQNFALDDPALKEYFNTVSELGMIIVAHCGYDVAFPRDDRAAPQRIIRLLNQHPDLQLVTTHLGAWQDWENVCRLMLGRQIWIETSYSLNLLPPETAREMLLNHPPKRLLFGTDSPWRDQSTALDEIRALNLPQELENAILHTNALNLFPL